MKEINQLDQFLTKNKLWQYCHQLIWTDRLTQNTVKRKLAGLKKFCQWAVEKGWLKENPFEEEKKREKGEKREKGIWEWLKLVVPIVSVVVGLVVLRVSLTHFPSPPEIPKAIPLPPARLAGESVAGRQILSQTSGFGRNLGDIREIGAIGEIGVTATQSATITNLAKEGQLTLPETLGIEAKEIALKTTDAYNGSITLNPDGQGVINLLFEGQSPKGGAGGFLNIQNANLSEGNLIYASVANDQAGFNFLQFQGSTDLSSRFTVNGSGGVFASGGLNLGSGQITSSKNLVFSPQDQPILVLAPKQSLLKGNLAISGQLYDGGLGIFGTTGEPLPQTFDFTEELTIEFEFLTGAKDLIIKFNLDKGKKQYYQAVWQTNGEFAIQTCNSVCSAIGSVAHYPFEESNWHHGRIYINDSYLIWELDLSAQKVSVPVQITTTPLLSSGYIEFSENFAAIANLKITQGGNPILTSGHGRVGGNLEVAGGIRLGQLSSQSSSTHICRNALGDLAECSADYVEWYPTSLREEIQNSNDQNSKPLDPEDISGTLVSITNIPNPVDDPTARYMAALSNKPYDGNILGVLADPSLGANGRKLNETYQPLVLTGRVAVKVSDINGPIEVGDPITSSEIPGVGMKATEAGAIIGKALESSGKSENILVLINPGWWEPENKNATRETKPSSGFTELVDSTESNQEDNPIQLNSLIIERLRTTGQAEVAEQLIAQALEVSGEATVAGQLTTGSLETEKAKISHLVADEIESETITALEDQFGNLLAKVEELESEGKEGPEGQEEPEEIARTEEFENSELLAQVNQFIQELQEIPVDTLTNSIANDINISENTKFSDTGYAISDMRNETPNPQILDTPAEGEARSPRSSYGEAGQRRQIQNLTVAGPASLGQTTIAGNLLVDSSLQLGSNSINSLNNILYLQNYGFGGVDILGGKVKIDQQGNLAVAGNVEIEKDLKVKKSLFASLIKPVEGQEITIEGDLKTTGTATFNKIIIAKANNPQYEEEISTFPNPSGLGSSTRRVSPVEISSNATADTAILPAGETELTIVGEAITDDSLIYITPLSPTNNKVLFIKAKKGPTECEAIELEEEISITTLEVEKNTPSCLPKPGFFTIGIDEPIPQDIQFNWWVIN